MLQGQNLLKLSIFKYLSQWLILKGNHSFTWKILRYLDRWYSIWTRPFKSYEVKNKKELTKRLLYFKASYFVAIKMHEICILWLEMQKKKFWHFANILTALCKETSLTIGLVSCTISKICDLNVNINWFLYVYQKSMSKYMQYRYAQLLFWAKNSIWLFKLHMVHLLALTIKEYWWTKNLEIGFH